ncbi:MAG: DUF3592 domain-containing protein [Clostridia bacterium]|nr:DUF3592 domain-containing protein [Clostridia bacterium]
MMLYIMIAVIVAVIAVAVIFTSKRNKEIDQNGIEADAVVTRINVNESVDEDGSVTTSKTFYVTYQTRDGQSVEAKLGSGKSFDVRIGHAWDDDLYEGCRVRIKYLPEKPKYAVRLS